MSIHAFSDRTLPEQKSWMLERNERGEGVLLIYEKQADGRSICIERTVLPGGKMTIVDSTRS